MRRAKILGSSTLIAEKIYIAFTKMNKLIIIGAVLLVAIGGWYMLSGEESPRQQVSESIVGKWRGVNDEKLEREFKEGGVVTDWYNGQEMASGTWSLFDASDAPAYLLTNDDSQAIYLVVNLTGEETGGLYFLVNSVNAEGLELSYLDSGRSLEFSRVQ